MRVCMVCLRWDYKDPTAGDSFEFTNLWDSLRRMPGVEAELFGFDEVEATLGRSEMNRALIDRVKEKQPDLVVTVLFEDEFDFETIDQLTAMTTTVNWFTDDHWRFEAFSRHWAQHFTMVVTTDEYALERYRAAGVQNVYLSQWGCNTDLFRPLPVERDVQVSFVGRAHGDRRRLFETVEQAGLSIEKWGSGWPHGRLSTEKMVEMFCRTKVNLNLSNSSTPEGFGGRLAALARRRGASLPSRKAIRLNVIELRDKRRTQLKARVFEVPGCGGFLLTSQTDDLEQFLVPGREVETFDNGDELIEKSLYYLSHDEERERIAAAGLERVRREHSYQRRFEDVFSELGVSGREIAPDKRSS